MSKTIDFGEVKRSIRDLVRIYKPKEKGTRKFVEDFVRKYNVQKGFENELVDIVLEELRNIESRETESKQI